MYVCTYGSKPPSPSPIVLGGQAIPLQAQPEAAQQVRVWRPIGLAPDLWPGQLAWPGGPRGPRGPDGPGGPGGPPVGLRCDLGV